MKQQLYSHLPPFFKKTSKIDEQDMRDTAGETRIKSYKPLYLDLPALVDQQELIYNSSGLTDWKTCREW